MELTSYCRRTSSHCWIRWNDVPSCWFFIKRNMSKFLWNCQKIGDATCKSGISRQKQYPPDYCFLDLNLWFENFAPPPATIKKGWGGTFNTCSDKILGCVMFKSKQKNFKIPRQPFWSRLRCFYMKFELFIKLFSLKNLWSWFQNEVKIDLFSISTCMHTLTVNVVDSTWAKRIWVFTSVICPGIFKRLI